MDDLISRQAAIDICDNVLDVFRGQFGAGVLVVIKESVEELPSAQPEIIRCKDCKHRDLEDKKCDCGHDIQWQLPRQDDWFCADAERREVTE